MGKGNIGPVRHGEQEEDQGAEDQGAEGAEGSSVHLSGLKKLAPASLKLVPKWNTAQDGNRIHCLTMLITLTTKAKIVGDR